MRSTFHGVHWFNADTADFHVAHLNSISATIAAYPGLAHNVGGWRLLHGVSGGRFYEVDVRHNFREGTSRPFRASEASAHAARFPTITDFLEEALPLHSDSTVIVGWARFGDDGPTVPTNITRLDLVSCLITNWTTPIHLTQLGLFRCRVVGAVDFSGVRAIRWAKSHFDDGSSVQLHPTGSTTVVEGGYIPQTWRDARPTKHNFRSAKTSHPLEDYVMQGSGVQSTIPIFSPESRIPDEFAE